MTFADEISVLSRKQIREAVIGTTTLSRSALSLKTKLLDAVNDITDEVLKDKLRGLAAEKKAALAQKVQDTQRGVKRKRVEQQFRRRVEKRMEVLEEDISAARDEFMSLPTQEETKECYRQFYAATGSAAFSMGVCAICAREVNTREAALRIISINDIPNPHRLAPRTPHPAHDLYRGMLLEPRGITRSGKKAKICSQCFDDLQNDGTLPPTLSLANNLWVGRVPWELEMLSFAEQLLVAQLYPRAYIFKLWPTSINLTMDTDSLQRGLRGNVTTFELDYEGIASMTSGRMMPRPVGILASIIVITITGRGSLPKNLLRSLFRVRRRAVYLALLWLKKNNPYYANIEIDEGRLSAFPDDDVPEEVLNIVRQNTDVGIIDEERSGYIQNDDEAGNGE